MYFGWSVPIVTDRMLCIHVVVGYVCVPQLPQLP